MQENPLPSSSLSGFLTTGKMVMKISVIPAGWPDDHILVIDSLSRWCDACYNLHDQATPKTGKSGGDYDGRAAYWSAQDDMEKQIATITSASFPINTIVIGHGVYMKLDDGTTRILPQGIGSKLSPRFPTYFPNVVYYTNKDDKRTIQLESNRMVNLANDASLNGDPPHRNRPRHNIRRATWAAERNLPKPIIRHLLRRSHDKLSNYKPKSPKLTTLEDLCQITEWMMRFPHPSEQMKEAIKHLETQICKQF